MNDERYVRKGYKIWDTYSDKEVQELNYRSQSDYMCEVLNEKEIIIQRLESENENLRKQVESSEITSNATSNYNAFLESKITTLEKENEQLQKENVFLAKQRNYWKGKCEIVTFETDEETTKKIRELEKQNKQLKSELIED